MTVAQLLAQISSRELSEWLAYAELEPFGEGRADLRAGIVAATVANTQRDPKVRPEPFTAQDFLPDFGSNPAEPAAPELQRAKLEALNAAFGGRDLRPKSSE